jgi:hypothetical protein
MKGQNDQTSGKKKNKRYILAVDDNPEVVTVIEQVSNRQA